MKSIKKLLAITLSLIMALGVFSASVFAEEETDVIENEIISIVDITVAADEEQAIGGHYGGDYFIMKDLVKFLNGEKTSSSTTVIEDSVNGHLCCYAAEKSRKEKRVVDITEEYGI